MQHNLLNILNICVLLGGVVFLQQCWSQKIHFGTKMTSIKSKNALLQIQYMT